MGVPKFYRWISERYPCLSETVKEFQIPEFDNLYLDMNGIVHVCSHPEDDNPHFRITEERIFKDIFHYIEFIYRMIKPKKVFFMAIDGVAPRAKMNQQRGRRFRSAREAEELIKRAENAGEVLPTEKRFDSNCITPGTPFMVRLQEALKYFVVQKITNDPLWQGPRIYLSGHETPGEGEHKVMDFIRYEKSGDDYDSNTRHCLYGLDADLLMLGLTSHEPHFSLLREEVRFGGKKDQNKRPATPEETTFHLLHLTLLREYIDYEFSSLKSTLSFPYNLENIIDDWILMGFLVGNDFIPHLPYLHIKNDALPMLWQTYMQVLPKLDGYINEGGHLNLKRFETYINTLAQFDTESFKDQYTDIKWMESKVGNKHINESAAMAAQEDKQYKEKQRKLAELSPFAAFEDSEPSDEFSTDPSIDKTDDDDDDDNFDTFDAEFRQHKRNYYMDKLEYENVTPDVLESQAKGYVTAIQWILLYYFEGVPSWGWFYSHHYAPFVSDVKNFSDMKIEFELGKPFLPFQQLMAVLPAASKDLLPRPLQTLMITDSSPVKDFYPLDFKTDLNGKQQEWEAVVLIPFIDEKRLLDAMATQYKFFTTDEMNRNVHGPCLMSEYDVNTHGVYRSPLPGSFPDIGANHTRLTEIPITEFNVDPNRLRKGLMDGVKLDVYFPGFPTLKHIPHTAKLGSEGVKVFQMNSRGQNMMLDIKPPQTQLDIELVVKDLLGKTTFVGWPHLFESKIVSISDGSVKYDLVEENNKGKKVKSPKLEKKVTDLSRDEAQIFYRTVDNIKERYHDRHGVNIGITPFLLYGCPMSGRKYACGPQGRITLEKQFSTMPVPFSYQATVQNLSVHDPTYCEYMSMEELFSPTSAVFMLGSPHYGCQGEVVEVDSTEGRVRVNFVIPIEPDINTVVQQFQGSSNYMPGYVASQRIGIHTHFLSRITGTIYFQRGSPENPSNGKTNVGLNLKFSKRGMEVPGYTKKTEDGWLYSNKVVDCIGKYVDKFSQLCDYLTGDSSSGNDSYSAYDVFGEEGDAKLKEIEEFIKSLPCSSVAPVKSGSQTVDEGLVKAIEEEASRVYELNQTKEKCVKMQVKPYLLFKPIIGLGPVMPDPEARFELHDRIVISKQGYAVPFGLRGTIVGIHPAEKEMDVLYDIVFDKEFVGGIEVRCSKNRGYRVPCFTMINLTYGEMKEKGTLHLRGQKTETDKPNYNRRNAKPRYGIYFPGSGQNDQSHYNSKSSAQNQRTDQRYQTNPYSNAWSNSSPNQGRSNSSYQDQSRSNAWNSSNQGQNQGYSNVWSNSSQGQDQGRPIRGQDLKHKEQHTSEDMIFNNLKYSTEDVKPQFVTPKVSPQKPMRKSYTELAGQSHGRGPPQQAWPSTSNTEFSSMWSQLQAKSPNKQLSSDSNPESNLNSTSLNDAAKALQKLTPPASSSKLEYKTNNVPASPSPNVTAEKRPSDLNLSNTNNNNSNTSRKIDLNQLFDSLGNQKAVAPDMTTEVSSIFNSLSVFDKQPIADDSKKTEPVINDNGSNALKQMLHVNTEDKSNDTGTNPKSYGTQLSVQDLFKVAKENSPPSPNTRSSISPNQQQQQKSPRSDRHQVSDAQQTVTMKPVEDLKTLFLNMFNQKPEYDIHTVNPNGYKVYVTIPNMGRFNGAVCGSKQEAMASAASIALLRLGGARTAFSRFPGHHGNRGVRQLFSPNSAFSPVLPAQQMGNAAQFRHPFRIQGYPSQVFQQQQAFNAHNIRQMAGINQWGGYNQRPPPQPNQHAANRFPHGIQHPTTNQQGGYSHQHQMSNYTGQHGGNKMAENIPSENSTAANPFIPLQVTKKQKTPQKSTQPPVYADASSSLNDSKSSNDELKILEPIRAKPVTPKTPKSEPKDKKSPPKSQKKRRPRIAANLNFEQ